MAQTTQNRDNARTALKSYLEPTGHGKAKSAPKAMLLKDELELLANYFLSVTQGVKWIPGPLKKVDKAMGKTVEDYGHAWGLKKDLVRGTLACNTNEDLRAVAALVRRTCTNEYGMFPVKQDEQASVRDGGASKAGYSGWNFVVQFKEHVAFGAEIQANTFDMLYGKMSKSDFCSILKYDRGGYGEMQNRLGFTGGLGHALYDIQDVARSKATPQEGDIARELSLDYNDACRGRLRTTLASLNQRILAFGGALTSSQAQALWKHGVEGSEWPGLLHARA